MFNEWREWRKASRVFKASNEKWKRLEQEKKFTDEPIDFFENEEFKTEYGQLRRNLQIAETTWLITRANKLGIEVFRELPLDACDRLGQPTWWDKEEEATIWEYQLNYLGASRLRSLIKDKQYELAKKWTDLLAPILSTIISLIALGISIIALYRS